MLEKTTKWKTFLAFLANIFLQIFLIIQSTKFLNHTFFFNRFPPQKLFKIIFTWMQAHSSTQTRSILPSFTSLIKNLFWVKIMSQFTWRSNVCFCFTWPTLTCPPSPCSSSRRSLCFVKTLNWNWRSDFPSLSCWSCTPCIRVCQALFRTLLT